MKLHAFLKRFGSFSKAFWDRYPHPLLLEVGTSLSREVYTIQGEADQPIVLGRASPSDVPIPDSRISSRHLRFHPPAPPDCAWQIEDLGSTNGTILNGALLNAGEPQDLPDASQLVLGPGLHYTFLLPASFNVVLRELSGQEGEGEDVGGTTSRIESQPVPKHLLPKDDEEDGVLPQPAPAGQELYLYADPFDPLALHDGEQIVIGRKPGFAQWVLPHEELSRRHFEVRRRGSQVEVRDLGSTNGTFLGTTRLGPAWVDLYPRKRIKVGPFQVWLDGPPEPTSAHTLRLDNAAGEFEGRLESFPLEQVMREIESQARMGVLRVEGEGPSDVRGEVVYAEGLPFKASTEEGDEGTGAIRRLLEVTEGRFFLRETVKDSGPPTRLIRKTFTEILT